MVARGLELVVVLLLPKSPPEADGAEPAEPKVRGAGFEAGAPKRPPVAGAAGLAPNRPPVDVGEPELAWVGAPKSEEDWV